MIKRFWPASAEAAAGEPDWEGAEVKFVAAGKTLGDRPPDEDPDLIHVDTGLGKFDHHQDQAREPACIQVFKQLKRKNPKFEKDAALKRLLAVVAEVDLGNYIHWPEGKTSDRYEFSLDALIGGAKKQGFSDQKLVDLGLVLLDLVYDNLKEKVEAEKLLLEGQIFPTKWGKAIAFESRNDLVIDLGEKKGYSLAVRKDPQTGSVRIYARNDRGVDLTPVFEKLRERDPEATWFLHQSKCLLLNGSSTNPQMKPTKLSLGEVVEILKRH